MHRVHAIMALVGIATSGCSKSASPPQSLGGLHPSISEIATHYTNFIRLTTNSVYVNPGLSVLCDGPSKEMVDEARVDFGPHTHTAIHVYMNAPAAEAFTAGRLPFPVGAIVVKQKLGLIFFDAQDGKPHDTVKGGVGGMVKRSPGYDPEHGDWEYFYFEDPSQIEQGRISTCVNCHESAKGNDNVFGTWRKKPDQSQLRP